jgi:hypothetical protein
VLHTGSKNFLHRLINLDKYSKYSNIADAVGRIASLLLSKYYLAKPVASPVWANPRGVVHIYIYIFHRLIFVFARENIQPQSSAVLNLYRRLGYPYLWWAPAYIDITFLE